MFLAARDGGLPLITNESEWFNKRNVALIQRNRRDLVLALEARFAWYTAVQVKKITKENNNNNNNNNSKKEKFFDPFDRKTVIFVDGDVAAKY